jgi:hypothetical protein
MSRRWVIASTLLCGLIVSVRAAEVTGRVTDPAGAPFQYARIILTDLDHPNSSFSSAVPSNGEFHLNVPDGRYAIRVAAILSTEVRIESASVQGRLSLGTIILQQIPGCILRIDAPPQEVKFDDGSGGSSERFGPNRQQWLDASNISRFRLPPALQPHRARRRS